MNGAVLIVIGHYNEADSEPTISGVFDSMDALRKGMKKHFENHMDKNYGYADLQDTLGESVDDAIDTMVSKLIRYDVVVDPMDSLMTWYLHDRTIQK